MLILLAVVCRYYHAGGDLHRNCDGTTGLWSGDAILCSPCSPAPPPPTNVSLTSCMDGTCSYECSRGFHATTSLPVVAEASVSYCSTTSGEWSPVDLRCGACTPPVPAPHTRINCTGHGGPEECELSCDDGW